MNIKDITSPNTFFQKVDQLQQQLGEVSRMRTISCWDLYNIKRTIYSSDLFAEELAALEPNSSAVINCLSFVFNGERYYRGDLIIKDAQGQLIHILSENQGTWVPSVDKDGNLVYNYNNTQIEDGSSVEVASANEVKTIYGQTVYPSGTTSFTIYQYNTSIRPTIRFYNEQGEEIYCDYTCSDNGLVSGFCSYVYRVVIK